MDGGDVRALIKARTTLLPFPLVEQIALHLLRSITHPDEHSIAHTDIKCETLFSKTMTADNIEERVAEEPSRRHAPEASSNGPVEAAASQPLPMISEDEAMRATYLLVDFGCGTHFRQTFSIHIFIADFSTTLGLHTN